MENFFVKLVEKLKNIFHAKTWHIESVFVLLVLVVVAIFSHKGLVEWVGVFAVWFTFMHASVANRLEEKEKHRAKHSVDTNLVYCYSWISRYFFTKEILWFVYFFFLGAWSALAGCILFLLYGWWRRLWRKYHRL